jgi:hypothetical protein
MKKLTNPVKIGFIRRPDLPFETNEGRLSTRTHQIKSQQESYPSGPNDQVAIDL